MFIQPIKETHALFLQSAEECTNKFCNILKFVFLCNATQVVKLVLYRIFLFFSFQQKNMHVCGLLLVRRPFLESRLLSILLNSQLVMHNFFWLTRIIL